MVADHDAPGSPREAVRRRPPPRVVGEIDQVPSSVSAIKVDGRRAYERVRSGEDVELKSRRQVTVQTVDVVEVALPQVRIQDALLERHLRTGDRTGPRGRRWAWAGT